MVRLNYTAPPKRPWWKHESITALRELVTFVGSCFYESKVKEPPVPLDVDEANDPKIYGRYEE